MHKKKSDCRLVASTPQRKFTLTWKEQARYLNMGATEDVDMVLILVGDVILDEG